MTDQARVMAPPSNALALASLVLGIAAHVWQFGVAFAMVRAAMLPWLLASFPAAVLGLLAIIFGFIGVTTANRLGGARKSYAIWGIVLGFTPLVAGFVGVFIRALLFGAS